MSNMNDRAGGHKIDERGGVSPPIPPHKVGPKEPDHKVKGHPSSPPQPVNAGATPPIPPKP